MHIGNVVDPDTPVAHLSRDPSCVAKAEIESVVLGCEGAVNVVNRSPSNMPPVEVQEQARQLGQVYSARMLDCSREYPRTSLLFVAAKPVSVSFGFNAKTAATSISLSMILPESIASAP